MGVMPTLLIGFDSEDPIRLDIIDESGFVYNRLNTTLDDTLKNGEIKFQLNQVLVNDSLGKIISSQRLMVEDEKIEGFLYVPTDVSETNYIEFYAKNVANFDLNRRIRGAVGIIVTNHRLEQSGLDAEKINNLTRGLSLKTYKIVKGVTQAESGFLTEYLTTFAFVIILYITILGYGANVMREIIQEKSSRIIEVLLSSANPFQLMAGKILGQASVGLTQYMIWSIIGIGLATYGGTIFPSAANSFNFSPAIFIYFILFYILGFFLFASLYAGVGAITNSEQEAQQIAAPIILILIVPLMLIGFMVKNPDSTMVAVLSYIPVFTPIIMFTRINLSTPSSLEIFGSILLLIFTILLIIWITSKIFRIGILMYGKRPTLPEIVKWIRV
jgi:ABC-2 type transport system permease protein